MTDIFSLDGLKASDLKVLSFGYVNFPYLVVLFPGDVQISATFLLKRIYLGVLYPELHASPHMFLGAPKSLAVRARPHLAWDYRKMGGIDYVDPVPPGLDPDRYVRALLRALNHAIGNEARKRCRMLVDALDVLLAQLGHTGGLWCPKAERGLQSDGVHLRSHAALKTTSFDPSRFVRHVRCIEHGELRRIPSLIIGPSPDRSAHELMELTTATAAAFAKRGIDIAAWWEEQGAAP